MTKAIDLSGERFGRLTVIEDSGLRKRGGVIWTCLCDCGNKKNLLSGYLRSGDTRSCGCLHKEVTISNLKDQRFGRLIVIEDSGQRGRSGTVRWTCMCDCGTQAIVESKLLKNGETKSCGCLHRQVIEMTGIKIGRLTVLGKNEKKNSKAESYWDCLCECGNRTIVNGISLRRGNTRSCGCLVKDVASEKMKNTTGEKHHNYNPALTQEERLKGRYILGGESMQKWRIAVFGKDNYKCQLCGARGGKGRKVILNAHHLDGWHWCKERRFDLNNGMTLCESCHKEFHLQYGRSYNTKEQMEKFILKRN